MSASRPCQYRYDSYNVSDSAIDRQLEVHCSSACQALLYPVMAGFAALMGLLGLCQCTPTCMLATQLVAWVVCVGHRVLYQSQVSSSQPWGFTSAQHGTVSCWEGGRGLVQAVGRVCLCSSCVLISAARLFWLLWRFAVPGARYMMSDICSSPVGVGSVGGADSTVLLLAWWVRLHARISAAPLC